MSPDLQNSEPDEVTSLPQCGFGADIDFDTLIKTNRFLFRVYTPKERSPFSDDTDPFFVAPRFDEQFARSPVDLPNIKFSEPVVGSYAGVARHMDWTTRPSSTYISTSFSFSWAIWEAVRRYHCGVKKDVEIAVIDATALGGRAATAVQLLRKASQKERTEQYWKWHRFSQDSQSVLVYGMVPRTAILASIPLLQILRKMPSYFLRKDVQLISGNPLDQVAWEYENRKVHYRQFCKDMSKRFLRRPVDVRLRDSTAGAVRLALSFLRPFFHRVVQDDFDIAISYLRTFAIAISGWPGDWWVRDHPEIQKIVESMVLALGEELKLKYASQQREEITRLQVVIDGLEQTIKAQSTVDTSKRVLEDVEVDSDGDFEVEFEETDEPTLVAPFDNPPAVRRQPSLKMSVAVLPRIPISFQTPITPPESPRSSLFIPTAIVPLAEIASTPLSFKSPMRRVSFGEGLTPLKVSPNSGSPASPPPSPPFHSSIFSPPIPHQDGHGVSDLGKDDDTNREADAEQTLVVEAKTQESDPIALEEWRPLQEEHNDEPLEEEIQPSEPFADEEDMDDGEETEHDSDGESSPLSPFSPWVPIHSSAAFFSSPRSSIISIETLCEPEEFPTAMKRMSHTSDTFEFLPRVMPMRSLGLASRTVSFSEPEPRFLLPMVTPPSPAVDPAAIPLPPSPPAFAEELPSSPSLSTSSSSSLSPPVSPSPPLELHLAVASPGLIIPPKRRISLLSPLPRQDDDMDDDTLSTLSTSSVTETVSYIVTGFLVGTFLTLFLFSTQRRTMLYLT